MTNLLKQANEPLTFESLNFHTPLIANFLTQNQQTIALPSTLAESDYMHVLSNYLVRFYVAGFAKTRQFSSEEERVREFTTVLAWLISQRPDETLGVSASAAYKALGVSKQDVVALLRTFIEESQSSTPTCLSPYQEAALVFDKVRDAGQLLHADMEEQIDTLILRPELRKAMSVREAIVMSARHLDLARNFYLKAAQEPLPWLEQPNQNIFELVKARMLRIYQMSQDIKLVRPSRLEKGLEHIYMAQAGVL